MGGVSAQFRRSGPGAFTAFLRLDTQVDLEDTPTVSADQVKTAATNLNHTPLAFMNKGITQSLLLEQPLVLKGRQADKQ